MKSKDKEVWGYFYRSTGGRFTEDPSPEMVVMRDETIPLEGIHLFDKAHAVMLIEQNIIRKEHGNAILQAFREMDTEGYENVRKKIGGGGHSGEAYLIDKLGMEIGGQINVGRSSADLIGIAIRIEERNQIIDILDKINNLKYSFIELAEHHFESLIPAYTHFQQAQPITFAHYLLSWVYALDRDFDRFIEIYKRTNSSPAGAAIVSGSPFPIKRERVAELLGFDSVICNTRDAIFGYDHHLELFSDIAILNNNLARFCSDLYIWSSFEFDMVELKDRFCGTSSINPCKKNPQALEQIFSLAALAAGKMMTAFSVDRMPSESWEIQWRVWSQQLWPLLKKTIQALTLIKSIIETLEIKTERMAELARKGWTTSSDLAATIVKSEALPWRTAHQIVAQLVRICLDRGIIPRDITTELLNEVAVKRTGKKLSLTKEIIDRALDPYVCVSERQLTGGPAPQQVSHQIEECLIKLKSGEKNLVELKDSLGSASRKLERAIKDILNE